MKDAMIETSNKEETKTDKPETVEITDVSQFGYLISQWHASKVAILEHMLKVPEGTEMVVDGGTPVNLTGDMLSGFKAGITCGLMELGILPFVLDTTTAATTDESVSTKIH